MSTKIIRYSNRAEFKIENLKVDLTKEDIEVVDFTQIDENHIYYIGGPYKELVSKEIGQLEWKRALIDNDFYTIDNCEELINTGHTTANYYQRNVDVYAGLHAVKALEEIGEKSLLKCYEYIAERRKEHEKNLAEIKLLRQTAKNLPINNNISSTIVDDIKWFINNRKEIKAKCIKKNKKNMEKK